MEKKNNVICIYVLYDVKLENLLEVSKDKDRERERGGGIVNLVEEKEGDTLS